MNQEMEQDTEQEIDFSQVFWGICRKWRMVLCWMLAAAVLVGAVKFALTVYSVNHSQETALAEATYNALVANNKEERRATVERLGDIAKEIDEQQKYVENSRYMKIDPYAVAIAKRTYYVKTDYQIMPDMSIQNPDYTSTIVSSYVQILTSESNLQTVGKEFNMELRYIRELVSAWSSNSGTFTVQVICDNEADATKILGMLDNIVTANKTLIENALDEHTVGKLSDSVYTTVDSGLLQQQQDKRDTLSKLRTQFTEQSEHYDELKEEALQIKKPATDTTTALKSSIKMAIVGALVGLVIACAIACVKMTAGNRIYSADDLARRQGLKILGTLPADTAKIGAMKKFDLKLRSKAGLSTTTDATGVYAAAMSFVAGAYPEAKTVLVAGSAEENYIRTACEAFQAILPEKKFLQGSRVSTDADTIGKVGQCDLVVLIEQAGVSCYSDVNKETETVKRLKGTVAGVLMID